MASNIRIASLDAFRGIAVLWVVVYHYTYFWTPAGAGYDLLPYGAMIAGIPLADIGGLGVILFFLISGYVISMTLSRTSSLRNFAIKRAARLWPTLIVCGTITYVIVSLLDVEALKVGFPEYFFSILFLPPEHVGKVFGYSNWTWLDGAYWSLWVEVRFYGVIGLLYYLFRRSWLLVWLGFELVGWLFQAIAMSTGSGSFGVVESLLFSHFTPYFTVGIIAYNYHQNAMNRVAWAGLALALAHFLFILFTVEQRAPLLSIILGYSIVAGLFGTFMLSPKSLDWINSKLLISVGQSSYSLYLLHQAIGVSLIAYLGKYMSADWSIVTLPIVMIAIIFLAHVVFKFVEQPSNRWVVGRLVKSHS